uniref:Uncharacterized protein n=1 Tax=Arundo donax TaxID=35708 RepID=A0A0A9EG43_ARUDO
MTLQIDSSLLRQYFYNYCIVVLGHITLHILVHITCLRQNKFELHACTHGFLTCMYWKPLLLAFTINV